MLGGWRGRREFEDGAAAAGHDLKRFVAFEARTVQRKIKYTEDVYDLKELIALRDEQLIAAKQ